MLCFPPCWPPEWEGWLIPWLIPSVRLFVSVCSIVISCQSIGAIVERKLSFSQLCGPLLWNLFYMDSNSPPVLNALLSWQNSSSIWFIIPPFSTTNALLDCNKVSDFIYTLSNNHSAISFRVSPHAAGSHKHPISPRIRNNYGPPNHWLPFSHFKC